MRKYLVLVVLMTAIAVMIGGAHVIAKEPQHPIYMTTCGQGPDAMMLDVLLNKVMGLTVKYNTILKAEECADMKTLIFVAGYSGKGMTAASINDVGEEARVKGLVELARKNEAYIMIVHMGGTTRRGASSDKFTEMAGITADLFIVIPDSNNDGYFNKLAAAKNAKLTIVDIPDGGSARTLVAQAIKEALPPTPGK